ncbi:hypothetical protein [Mycobacterium vicinigordonae]|uniref:Uncharacterized protein n=1 Tax=Mycobacterium vicinigordonae TaxID=1719132 RepID=A0A7D6I206_9MYCO|nr:hypothetical protein [Mycobacterium vicinigordonae]QLL05038.1 hypothetical protein H0P51_18270 [Mycobacterium vicinigordonae]
MGRKSDGSKGAAPNPACPLHCGSRQTDDSNPQISWAGLPVNLDLAFSQNQRDKVYAQHLRRRQDTSLRRRANDVTQLCVCEASGYMRSNSDVDKSVAGL